jgi:hypothetical protein
MRVLITGDRFWVNELKIRRMLRTLQEMYPTERIIIVQGDAPGADRIAKAVATELFGADNVESHPADWHKYKRAAGIIRNRYMLDESARRAQLDGHPIRCAVAFHSDLSQSRGTKNMVEQLDKAGIPVLKIK